MIVSILTDPGPKGLSGELGLVTTVVYMRIKTQQLNVCINIGPTRKKDNMTSLKFLAFLSLNILRHLAM